MHAACALSCAGLAPSAKCRQKRELEAEGAAQGANRRRRQGRAFFAEFLPARQSRRRDSAADFGNGTIMIGFQDRFICCATPTPAPDFNACDEWRAEWGNPAWRAGWPHDPRVAAAACGSSGTSRVETHSPRSRQRVMPLLLLFVCAPFRYAAVLASPHHYSGLSSLMQARVWGRAPGELLCAPRAYRRVHAAACSAASGARRRGGAREGIRGRRRRASMRRTLPPPAAIVLLLKFNNPSTLPLVATGWFAQKRVVAARVGLRRWQLGVGQAARDGLGFLQLALT
ncbi:hypothetical protein GGX14DRAFT_570446 [Mycena pura]|uniref:Uncharacterized protein n=1 Tax=Mycena pura TaxID=153505 RepID=A0AAD6V8M2_9AGAR|nr:hypothetical protein GGX14DRAFT_570446 [Mycena pura]